MPLLLPYRNSRLPLPSLTVSCCLLPVAPSAISTRLLSSSSRTLCRKSLAAVLFLYQPHRCLPQPLPDDPIASTLPLHSLSPSATCGVTREWVGEGELPKERTQLEVAKALRYADKGHILRDCMIRAAGELDCSSAYNRLREPDKSEDNRAMDRRAMGLVALWYCRGGTFMESSIPYSHGGRALVVKGTEVENPEINSKYQDKAEGQRPENFIR
ncbi:hypothetical protein B296_00054782 [Ensete ventricosum]|uniref:Uncharacterized protein n=1 Tax=Ensete ventricosum TaxID=4639 RepID=A0A426X2W7_ENSVE|nr:hypothetical protein B296_00054782 [Ensete ventricosum]